MSILYDPTGEPIEIAEGRGDLRWSSMPFSEWDGDGPARTGSVPLVDDQTISYANIFATQWSVAAAVMRLLSWSVRVPLKVYRRTGDDSRERLRPSDHPLADAINAPWELGSQAQLTMSLLGPLSVHGNATNEIDSGARDTLRWRPADWRTVKPIRPTPAVIRGWTVTVDGKEETVPADSMLHVAWWSPFGPLGVSPLQQLGTTVSIEEAAQRYQRGLLRENARPPSVITATEEFLTMLEPEERQLMMARLRTDVKRIYGSPDRAGIPAIFPPGVDMRSVGHTAVEAALIDQRRVAREEVAAVYQIPPPLIGIYDRATFSNIETAREIGYTDGLAPPLVLIESAITAHVCRDLLREPDLFVEYDFAGVLRGDRLKEIEAIREAVATAVLTPNEARATLNKPKSDQPGMDEFYLPVNNLSPVGSAPTRPDDAASESGAPDGD